MRLLNGLIQTPVARPHMSILDALRVCVDHGVPGLPFIDDTDRVVGRFSLRHTYLQAGIPADLIIGAHLIGHEALHLDHGCDHYAEMFAKTIDDCIIDEFASLSSDAQIIKAMALMEQYNSSYLFVIDKGRYCGTVTRLSLTRAMLQELS